MPRDAFVEYEPRETLHALEAAVRALGHTPVRLGNPHALLAAIGRGALPPVDAAWNIAEGYGARNREAWAPVLFEMAGVPTLGSDALTQSLSLDKAWTLDVVAAAGVATAGHLSVASAEKLEPRNWPARGPLFVKPRWEGTAKGIGAHSRVENMAALTREVARITKTYAQPALVEPFLPGAEYTVALTGAAPNTRAFLGGGGGDGDGGAQLQVLGVLQRALNAENKIGLHACESARFETPGTLTPALEAQLGSMARAAARALGCQDFARVDFKCDAAGTPYFLEINPLPSFAPDQSFAWLAEIRGEPYTALLAKILNAALARLGLADA